MNNYFTKYGYTHELNMPNNLAALIKDSGMTKRQVAAARGVTPETLSRHIHSKVPMTVIDAEAYANILNTSAQHVLFAAKPIPIIGTAHICDVGVERRMIDEPTEELFLHDSFSDDTAAFLWSADEGYSGIWYDYAKAIQMVLREPIQKNFVHPFCVQELSIVKLNEPVSIGDFKQWIISGFLYPEPKNLYTIYNPKLDYTFSNQKVQWSTPVVQLIIRPDMRGAVISKIES